MYNLEQIKETYKFSLEDIYNLLAHLDGDPILVYNHIESRTICHNEPGQGSHKLWYYENSNLFQCFTDCGSFFDVYQLVQKAKTIETGVEWSLPRAISYVLKFFDIEIDYENDEDAVASIREDFKLLSRYSDIAKTGIKKQKIEYLEFDGGFLNNLPYAMPQSWIDDGISKEIALHFNLRWDGVDGGIILPHYDMDNKLIGVRERFLTEEEIVKGKYRPYKVNKLMYRHQLGFNLYGLNLNKDAIKGFKKAIIAEGEKSPMQYASFFGVENNICVASCGMNLSTYQIELLLNLGVEEIIIGFDKQFQNEKDNDYIRLIKKLTEIKNKYGNRVQISFLFDTKDLLDFKDSPFDKGQDVFLQLFTERKYIN